SLRIGLGTQGVALPCERVLLLVHDLPNTRHPQLDRIDEPIVGHPRPAWRAAILVRRHLSSPLRIARCVRSVRDNYTGVVSPRQVADHKSQGLIQTLVTRRAWISI